MNNRNNMQETSYDVSEYIRKLLTISVVSPYPTLIASLEELEDKLASRRFQLVVLGQFKRGKTTLINALIGDAILPTSIVPLTSIVTILRYGKKEEIHVRFQDGRNKVITRKELDQYITESGNPMNEKKVDVVEITHASPFLLSGVEIIDTPGVGSVYKHNTDRALDFIPTADVGLFVITADPPISNPEIEFLSQMRPYLAKIIFIQNKIDQVDSSERSQSHRFTQRAIGNAIHQTSVELLPVSAKNALHAQVNHQLNELKRSGLPQLQEVILNKLITKKTEILQISVAKKLLYIIAQIQLALSIQRKAAQISVQELEEKSKKFKEELDTILREKEDADYIMQGQIERLTKETLLEDIESMTKHELPKMLASFDAFFQKQRDLSGKELSHACDDFLETYIKNIFTQWRRDEEKRLQNTIGAIFTRFSDQANTAINRILTLSAGLFHLDVSAFKPETELSGTFEFRFVFDEIKVDIDIYHPIVTRLPAFVSRRMLYNEMKRRIPMEFDRHCGRVRYDFYQRVLQSAQTYRMKYDETIEDLCFMISSAIDSSRNRSVKEKQRATEANKKIEEELHVISNIYDAVKAIAGAG